jgi:hypothetical protein
MIVATCPGMCRRKRSRRVEIAKAVTVPHFPDGTVRKSGQKLSVTAALERVDAGTPSAVMKAARFRLDEAVDVR